MDRNRDSSTNKVPFLLPECSYVQRGPIHEYQICQNKLGDSQFSKGTNRCKIELENYINEEITMGHNQES